MDEEPAPTTTEHNEALSTGEDGYFPIVEREHEPINLARKYDKQAFINSGKRDLSGMVNNGTFLLTPMAEVPNATGIFGRKFLDEPKRAREGLKRKSRLVSKGYNDQEATAIPTKAPNMERSSERMVMSLALSIPGTQIFGRHITQVYIQSRSAFERIVFIKAPTEMDLPPDTIPHVVKPLYGIPEAGLHWYLAYLSHHIDELVMM